MSRNNADRMRRLMPNGKPKYIRCYDNGGETADRYTVVFTGNFNNIGKQFKGRSGFDYPFVHMSAHPFSPQGIGMHDSTSDQPIDVIPGRWGGVNMGQKHPFLGKRICFCELPEDCRRLVVGDYKDIWQLYEETIS